MSFDQPSSAGPGPRWTGDGSLSPRVPVPEDHPASPAHGAVREAASARRVRPHTLDVGGVEVVLASTWRRMVGVFVDFALKVVILSVVLGLAGVTAEQITVEVLVAGQVLARGYDLIFYTQGWTPGSRITRTRIVRLSDGLAPGLRWGVARTAGAVVSETVVIGYAWAFWDVKRQTWQDKFAHTVVIEAPRTRVSVKD